jgi:hypothetical protein
MGAPRVVPGAFLKLQVNKTFLNVKDWTNCYRSLVILFSQLMLKLRLATLQKQKCPATPGNKIDLRRGRDLYISQTNLNFNMLYGF